MCGCGWLCVVVGWWDEEGHLFAKSQGMSLERHPVSKSFTFIFHLFAPTYRFALSDVVVVLACSLALLGGACCLLARKDQGSPHTNKRTKEFQVPAGRCGDERRALRTGGHSASKETLALKAPSLPSVPSVYVLLCCIIVCELLGSFTLLQSVSVE